VHVCEFLFALAHVYNTKRFQAWFKISVKIGIDQWILISISLISTVNIGNIDNIGLDIGWYCKIDSVSCTSKPDTILAIYIRISRYL